MDSWLKKSNDNGNKPTADDVEATVEQTGRSMRKTRLVISKTYNGSFLQYGFAFISENNKHCPLCLI